MSRHCRVQVKPFAGKLKDLFGDGYASLEMFPITLLARTYHFRENRHTVVVFDLKKVAQPLISDFRHVAKCQSTVTNPGPIQIIIFSFRDFLTNKMLTPEFTVHLDGPLVQSRGHPLDDDGPWTTLVLG